MTDQPETTGFFRSRQFRDFVCFSIGIVTAGIIGVFMIRAAEVMCHG